MTRSARIEITLREDAAGKVGRPWLRKVALAALSDEVTQAPIELGVVVAGDETIRRLNRQYRGRDSTTDVLSFSLQPEERQSGFVLPPDGVRHLGEVVISYPQAVRQAMEIGHSTETEIAALLVHGILHLLGYDHEGSEASLMTAKEQAILQRISPTPRIP